MSPGYEWYWTSIRNEPDKPVWITGKAPTPQEIEWALFAAQEFRARTFPFARCDGVLSAITLSWGTGLPGR